MMSALPYVDGAMQYERKYEDAEFNSVAAIDLVLRYAPLLFHAEGLDRVALLLKQNKRIEKLTAADMAQRLAAARQRMWENHRLFALIEAQPQLRQDQRIGLLERVPDRPSYRLAFVTRMGQVVPAKCPSCGRVAHAPKAFFLEPMDCPECGAAATSFVLLAQDTAVSQEG